MARSDRLLRLLQALRRHRRPVTADALAGELEVSVRTVYRDIAALVGNNAPIRGEAGVGYVLEAGYDLPPMMFTADEVEAILVGLNWTRGRADPNLQKAADDVIAKLGAVLPVELRPVLFDGGLIAPNVRQVIAQDSVDVGLFRRAIRAGHKVSIDYADAGGERSTRTIWPFGLAYFETVRVILAWCELRNGFRHFRTDRIDRAEATGERYPVRRAVLHQRWKEQELPRLDGRGAVPSS